MKTSAVAKWFSVILLFASLLSGIASAQEKIKIVSAGKEIVLKGPQPYFDNRGEIWAPALAISQNFAKKVYWNPEKQKMTIVLPSEEVSYVAAQKKKFIGSKAYDIHYTPVVKDGVLFLPLGENLELFFQTYRWDANEKIAYLFDPDRLLMKSLLKVGRIKDEFFYISDWSKEKNEIKYELRRNVDEEGISFLQGRFLYQMKTGNLYEMGMESDERKLIGNFPINLNTSLEYKMAKSVKLERDPKSLQGVDRVLTALILNDTGIIKLNKPYLIDTGAMTPKDRGEVMYTLVKDDYPDNKTKVFKGSVVEAGLPVDMKRIDSLSRILLGGPADLKEYRRSYKGSNDYLVMADGIIYPQLLMKYLEEKGNTVMLTGDIVWYGREFQGQVKETVGNFIAVLEKNPKSVWDGYGVKKVEYTYHKDPMEHYPFE